MLKVNFATLQDAAIELRWLAERLLSQADELMVTLHYLLMEESTFLQEAEVIRRQVTALQAESRLIRSLSQTAGELADCYYYFENKIIGAAESSGVSQQAPFLFTPPVAGSIGAEQFDEAYRDLIAPLISNLE